MAVHADHADRFCPVCLLVVDGDRTRAARIGRALTTPSGRASKVTVVSAAAEAHRVVSHEGVRAVLVEHRPAGGYSAQTVRALVKDARGRPVIWLIENHDVVEVAEAVAAGVSGAYYWDQVGPDLLSAIDRVAPAGPSHPAARSTGGARSPKAGGCPRGRLLPDIGLPRGTGAATRAIPKASASKG